VTGRPVRRFTIVRFVDTNVLLYAISRDEVEVDKARQARDLLLARDLGLSVQVLQEFYVQATRVSRSDRLSHEDALALVESWMRFPIAEITIKTMWQAFATRARYQISYWDALIVAAASALDCRVILSEDLADGQDYGGVRVENPFR
jgi:predicted nucleic acid-binding protein